MSASPRQAEDFLPHLLTLGHEIQQAVIAARASGLKLAAAARESAADTLYAIDAAIEPLLTRFFERIASAIPITLIAEGLHDEHGVEGERHFGPPGKGLRVLIDPIDGTRGLMYDKRSAWFLAGIAPDNGHDTRLSDIQAAVQVEIPTSKQAFADSLWATRGQGARALRRNVLSPDAPPLDLPLRPSTADNLLHGFATISNFFPGTKELAGKLAEKIAEACVGPADVTRATIFEDQYISTGGQLYELMMGHDRFIADLRPLFYKIQNRPAGLCVHPYDCAALLIAQEAGIEITDGLGGPLDGPLDTTTGLSWAGFANKALRRRIEPVMREVLQSWLNAKP